MGYKNTPPSMPFLYNSVPTEVNGTEKKKNSFYLLSREKQYSMGVLMELRATRDNQAPHNPELTALLKGVF